MQLWPANENAFAASFAAVPAGASAQTIAGRGVAELELDALAVRAFREAPADVARAGEGEQPHAFVLDQHVADLAGGAGDDVDPARRQACLLLELGEEERRERRRRRGLQHDGAARGERGRDLVGDEVEREVERRDRADDPDRQPQGQRELSLARRRMRPSAPSRRRACAPRRPRTCRSRRRAAPRRAPPSAACPPRRRRSGPPPRWRSASRRAVRSRIRARSCAGSGSRIARSAASSAPARLGGAALRDAPDDLARERRADVRPVAGLDALAADQERTVGRRRRHARTLIVAP